MDLLSQRSAVFTLSVAQFLRMMATAFAEAHFSLLHPQTVDRGSDSGAKTVVEPSLARCVLGDGETLPFPLTRTCRHPVELH